MFPQLSTPSALTRQSRSLRHITSLGGVPADLRPSCSNTEYSHYYAGHSEIQKYLLRMADKYETRKV